jgi:hypothetical protein
MDGVRAPNSQDEQDPDWRPIESADMTAIEDDEARFIGGDAPPSYPSDYTQLYYWKARKAN